MLSNVYKKSGVFHDRILWNESKVMNSEERMEIAKDKFGTKEFSRKDYLRLFKDISTATASRDLKSGADSGILLKKGDKSMTVYEFTGIKD